MQYLIGLALRSRLSIKQNGVKKEPRYARRGYAHVATPLDEQTSRVSINGMAWRYLEHTRRNEGKLQRDVRFSQDITKGPHHNYRRSDSCAREERVAIIIAGLFLLFVVASAVLERTCTAQEKIVKP